MMSVPFNNNYNNSGVSRSSNSTSIKRDQPPVVVKGAPTASSYSQTQSQAPNAGTPTEQHRSNNNPFRSAANPTVGQKSKHPEPLSSPHSRRFHHSRSQSHNSQSPSPSFKPIQHNQDFDANFLFNNSPVGTPPTEVPPKWTALIPPMPSKPKSAYSPDNKRELLERSYPSYQFQQKTTSNPAKHSNDSNHLQQHQRHSIAISPNSENQNIFDSSKNSGQASSHKYQAPTAQKPVNHANGLAPPHNVRNMSNGGTQTPPKAPTEPFPPKERLSSKSMNRKVSGRRKSRKTCKKCGLEITGQFVRALQSAYHVECFTCHECGNQCSSKFFPYEITDETNPDNKYQVALCEYDYFKKLDLICFNCDSALRGPYITALGKKYHLEHFKCNVCQKVFESDESYYEHEGNIYCHFHYSKLYASHCEGCHSSIVKQFVELYRGGRNQQWHPECYMVHKFWNVCIMADSVGLQTTFKLTDESLANLKSLKDVGEADPESKIDESQYIEPRLLIQIEQQIENIVMQSWLTLSGYEESTAACISDMLLNACTGNQSNGLFSTVKLVMNVEILFTALDQVSKICQTCVPVLKEKVKTQQLKSGNNSIDDSESSSSLEQDYFQPIKKEPRNLSGKIMSYLAILRKSSQISQSGSLSSELLSVITGCAHYLKLLIRIGLHNALKANKLLGSTIATDVFLKSTVKYEAFNKPTGEETAQDIEKIKQLTAISPSATDACVSCSKSIEKSCVRFQNDRWHSKCFKCSNCLRLIPLEEASQTRLNGDHLSISCKNCSSNGRLGFEHISDLSQLVYLLHIALSRSRSVMKVELGVSRQKSIKNENEPNTVSLSRSASIAIKKDESDAITEDNYSKTISDVTKLRTRRQSQKLSNSIKKNAKKYVILDAPVANIAKEEKVEGVNATTEEVLPDELTDMVNNESGLRSSDRKASTTSHLSYVAEHNETDHFNVRKALKIRDEPQRQLTNAHLDRTTDLLKNEKSLTLDDIPRIVAAEQARDQRPNAFKHHNSLYQRQKPMDSVKTLNSNGGSKNGPQISSPTNALDSILNTPAPAQTTSKKAVYYSELTKDEHFVMRHIAVEALMNTGGTNKYSKEEILGLIQTKKQPTFWDKFKFGGESRRNDKNMGVFGVDLQDLTKKYGVDSDLGVGPSKLRIPVVVDDVINALRQKDMSVEGIFRLNGNIKKLKELTDEINKNPLKSPDFSSKTAVQLAALMKKWLRELPNPLLTFNLYELWISSQAETNMVIRKRILQLVYCMLPRSHRNLVEVLLYFFSWVASFAEIDEETGSKMDIHNLATVIAPNILFAKQATGADAQPQSGDTYFLAIEVVNQLIELHEEISIIPDDLVQLFEKCGFSGSKSENLTTKEIMSRLEKETKDDANYFRNYEKLAANHDVVLNQMVHTNTISKGQTKYMSELHGETSNVE